MKMLMQLKDEAEIVITISADDIEKANAGEIWELPMIWTH